MIEKKSRFCVLIWFTLVIVGCTSKEQSLRVDCLDKKRSIACYEWSKTLRAKGDEETATRAIKRACELNHGDACFEVAEAAFTVNPDSSKNLYKIACNKGHRPSCKKWQELLDAQISN